MMNSLMSKESRGVSALKLRTVMKKERNGVQKSLIVETENEGDIIPPKY